MPDRVHAAVHPVQPAGSHAPENRVVVEPRGKQLRERDHTVPRAASAAITASGAGGLLLGSRPPRVEEHTPWTLSRSGERIYTVTVPKLHRKCAEIHSG